MAPAAGSALAISGRGVSHRQDRTGRIVEHTYHRQGHRPANHLPANTATYLPTRQQTSTTAGDVYVADYGDNRVLKLRTGSTAQVELPFTGFTRPKPPNDVAVDSAGNVYAVDSLHQRMVELPAGSATPVELSFGTGGDACNAT